MHRALEIQEILYDIFHQCTREKESSCGPAEYEVDSALLAALARTCRAFKEPALDVLWTTLDDHSPLVQCLPEASDCLNRLSRPLTQAEWDIFRSYARRIRSMYDSGFPLKAESYQLLSNPPTTEPLFPNLRNLRCEYSETTMSFFNLPLPSLVSLDVSVEIDSSMFQNSPRPFPAFSPNIREISISLRQGSRTIESSYICRWQNLRCVNSRQSVLGVDTLVYLSRMPALTQLGYALQPTLPEFDPPLSFSNLQHLSLCSTSLNMIVQLLSQTRLPALTDFQASIDDSPSMGMFFSFWNLFQACKVNSTFEKLWLSQERHALDHARSEVITLSNLGYLRPCITLGNLRQIVIDIACDVYLTDGNLLTLASSWPKLEIFRINTYYGWNSQCGITPDGLVCLLQKCQSLKDISLRLNTEYYAQVYLSHARVLLGLVWTRELHINVLDAALKKDCMLAITGFFSIIAACCGASHRLEVTAWRTSPMMKLPNAEEYRQRWRYVINSLPA